MMITAKRWLIWPVCVVLLACPQKTAVWLDSEATVDRAVFVLGREQGRPIAIELGLMRVDQCDALIDGAYPSADNAEWFLEAMAADVLIERLTYGSVPEGFREASPARNLELGGCYEVTITGSGTLRFQVAEDGRLHEAP